MKYLTYILLVYFGIGACIPKCDFSQLAQLDELVHHYELHEQEALDSGTEISFSEFLFIHFVERNDHDHPDKSEHQELPLYSFNGGVQLFLDHFEFAFHTIPEEEYVSKIAFFNHFYVVPVFKQVFRPPAGFID